MIPRMVDRELIEVRGRFLSPLAMRKAIHGLGWKESISRLHGLGWPVELRLISQRGGYHGTSLAGVYMAELSSAGMIIPDGRRLGRDDLQ